MKQVMTNKEERGYEWIDIAAPDKNDLQEIAGQFRLHEASVIDAQQPDHLPKYERLKNYIVIILRIYAPGKNNEADTVQELTNKLAVFIADGFIITIHQTDWPPLKKINEEYVKQGECKNPFHVLNEIVKAGLLSFDEPAKKLTERIEYYEERVFLKEQQMPLQKGLYYLKRKVGVYGMNFDFMPELNWKIGYPAVLILMVIVVVCVYLWFKRKRWL